MSERANAEAADEGRETEPARTGRSCHEEDLRRALPPVSAAFDEWKAGKLGNGDLAQGIHEFHHGSARELLKLHNGNHEWAVGHAIANGTLGPHPWDRSPHLV